MVRAIPRFAPIPIVLVLAAACSNHPTAPSQSSKANPPAAAPTSTLPGPGVPADVAEAGGFELLGSDPGPGSELAVTGQSDFQLTMVDLTVRLSLHFNQPLPDALWEMELLDGNGQHCAFGIDRLAVAPGHAYPISNAFWIWETETCRTFPVSIVTLKATLLTFRDIPGRAPQRIEHVTQTFPFRYTIRRYPPPPQNPPAAPPTVSRLVLLTVDPTGGAPGPGDGIGFSCTGKETDGAPVTVQITQRWDGRAPVIHSKTFEAGGSSSSSGAAFEIFLTTPSPARATIECAVTNDRGQHAVKTITIPLPG